MPVHQKSKIQVRRGLKEDMPQLSSGEFGWAIDTQELYIGAGTVEEGAPYEGIILINGDTGGGGNVTPTGLYIVPVIGGIAEFNGFSNSSQSLTLTGNTISTATNFSAGNPIFILVKQDSTGNWAFTWPTNFLNPPPIDTSPNSGTSQAWMKDESGNFYPFGPALWSTN